MGYRVATAQEAVSGPLKGPTKFPEVSQVTSSLITFSPELVTYLESPTTVCTLFAPSNQVCYADGPPAAAAVMPYKRHL